MAERAMTPERWRQVRDLFDGAVELPGDQRAEFLGQACGHDGGLYASVDALLRCHEEASTFIDRPFVRLAPRGVGEPLPMRAVELQRIGPYAVEQTLGRGGMGTVYLASRADQEYRRQVAVKVLRRELDDEDAVRRFRDERQILADLDHPNIARLHEGGTTDDGRPYLVMEYVQGEPLDRYCEARGLETSARLALFRKVCRAVQFAHQSLVVHRDLKPGNILVTAEGEPKLLDFGIAKLLGREGLQRTRVATASGQLAPMTLAYASPEQVRGEIITTASDVYSLGVVLYELLTGRRPYPEHARLASELVQAILEHQPERPSTIVCRPASVGSEARPVAGAKKGGSTADDLRKLRRTLRGDLDNIVLAALRKSAKRRYASVEELSRDLGRYQNDRPVAARPDKTLYRAGKFLRRHRLGAAVAAVALTVLVAFLVALLVQRQQILVQKHRAEEVTRVMIDLFEVSDPDTARGEEIKAREIMDRGAKEIRRRLQGQPKLLAELLETLAQVYFKLGIYDEAAPLLEDALILKRRVYGPGHRSMTTTLLQQGVLLEHRGDYAAAKHRYLEVLARVRGGRSAEDPLAEQALFGWASVSGYLGDYQSAERLHREALAMARRLSGDAGPRIAANLRALGRLYLKADDHGAARAAYLEALAIYRQRYGDDHPEAVGLLNNLGLVHHAAGDYDLAEDSYRTALAAQRELYGASHPSLATTLANQASLRHDQARYDAAEQLGREALALRREAYGGDHPRVAVVLNLLGLIHRDRGELDQAEDHFRRALAIWRRSLGEAHPEVAVGLASLAQVLRARGKKTEAEALLQDALRLSRAVFGDEHSRVASILHNLGRLARDRRDHAGAAGYYREALNLRLRLLGDGHPEVAETSHNLAVVLREIGDHEAAETLCRQALAIYRAKLGERHPKAALVLQSLAAIVTLRGRPEEGEMLARQAIGGLEAALPEGHLWIQAARSVLGESLAQQGRYAPAEEVLLASYARLRAVQGEAGTLTQKTRQRLVALYEAWGKPVTRIDSNR